MGSKLIRHLAIIASLIFSLSDARATNLIARGQYALGDVQQICLSDDGVWFGTTFNFSGNYSPGSVAGHIVSAMVGNYLVHSTEGTEKANNSISIIKSGTSLLAYWYDWFDGLSYSKTVVTSFQLVKNNCDPPFIGRNKGAATEFAAPVRPTGAAAFKSGQYQLGDPMIQEICLKDDGTWFGTTFHFSGLWVLNPFESTRLYAAIFGNYGIAGHKYKGFANDTITIGEFTKNHEPASADWFDWFDDGSFENVFNTSVTFVKADCDPPFKEQNTHAATN